MALLAAVLAGALSVLHPLPALLFLAGAAILAGAVLCRALLSPGLILWACLLLTPDFPVHSSLGLIVQWSHGLTFSNFLIPALAVPMLFWNFFSGRLSFPLRLPRCITAFALLLLWGAVTWIPWLFHPPIGRAGLLTILAHWGKLLLMLGVAAFVVLDLRADFQRLLRWFLIAMALNGLLSLLQVAHLVPVFSPLARFAATIRATGTFYDANLYGALVAFALLLALVALASPEQPILPRWGMFTVIPLLAASLVFAASRAGFLALAAGCGILLLRRNWKCAGLLLAGLVLATSLFPLRTWGRIRNTVDTGMAVLGVPRPFQPDQATLERVESMRDSLYQFAPHPWLGVGFGRALYLGMPARQGRDYAGPRSLDPSADRSFTGAQNQFLTVLAETGPLGLILFLAWLGSLFVTIRKPFPATGQLAVRGSLPAAASEMPPRQNAASPTVVAPPRPTAASLRARDLQTGLLAGCAALTAASCTIDLFFNARILAILLALAGAWEAGRPL